MPLRSSASWSNRLTSVSLFGNRGLKQRGERLARHRILELAQIGVLELAGQRRVVVGVERRVLLARRLKPFVDLLEHVGWELRCVAAERFAYQPAKRQLDRFDLGVQLAKLRRQIQPLLHEEVFDRFLKRALTLREERLVSRPE